MLILHASCWYLLKPPAPHSDDLVYVQVAESIADGSYELNESPKNHRFTVILPALFFMKVFGNNPFAISLWSLLCSMATIVALYYFLHRVNAAIAILSCLLLSLNIIQVIHSTVLFPDIIVSLFIFLVVIMIFEGRNNLSGKFPFLAALFFLIGFFAKEIMLLLIPFILYMTVADLKKGESKLFWKRFYLWMISVFFLLITGFYLITGDFLFILHSVENNHNTVFVPELSNSDLLKRLTIEPLVFLFSLPGYVFLILFALISFSAKIPDNLKEWKYYLLILTATFWWATTSVNYWAPVLLYDRMWMPLIVPLCVMSAIALHAFFENQKTGITQIVFTGVFLISGILYAFCNSEKLSLMFFLYALLPVIFKWKKNYFEKNKSLRLLFLLLPYSITLFYFILKNTNH